MFLGVEKVHVNGKLKDNEFAYIRLPDEASGGVAKLKRWLYGGAEAAAGGHADHLVELGFRRGQAAPIAIVHEEKGLRLVVRRDEFSFFGRHVDLKWVAERMSEWYEIKVRATSDPETKDDKVVRILNRKLEWKDESSTRPMRSTRGPSSTGSVSRLTPRAWMCPLTRKRRRLEASKKKRLAATVNHIALD